MKYIVIFFKVSRQIENTFIKFSSVKNRKDIGTVQPIRVYLLTFWKPLSNRYGLLPFVAFSCSYISQEISNILT